MGAPAWWGQGPIAGLRVKENQYRGNDGGYRPYMYYTDGLQRATAWDGYVGPNGEKLDSKGRIWGQYYEGGAERTGGSGGGGGGGGGAALGGSAPLDDGIYAQRRALALRQYQQSLGALDSDYQRSQVLAGVNAKFDTKGNLLNYEANPLSQYGTFQKMLWNQGMNMDSLMNSSFDRGLRGRGLGAQGLSDYRWQMGDDRLQFGRGLMDDYGSWQQGKLAAKNLYDQTLLGIEQDRIGAGIANGGDEGAWPGEDPAKPVVGGGGYAKPKQMTGYAKALNARSQYLNDKYKLGAGNKGPAWNRSTAAKSQALNMKYGLGAYAKSGIYYKTKKK